jgi:transposase-like protein
MNKSTKYSPEVRERAVRLVFEHEREAHPCIKRDESALW